jgi:integrase
MSVYKRGRVYWYNFEFQGERHQGSTRLRNERQAAAFEAKLKTDLALGLVGLVAIKPGPPFEKYAKQFETFIETRKAKQPRTVGFYKEKLKRLLEYKPLAECRLNRIDETLIEEYIRHRRKSVEPATVNRELATLRRALRLAWHTFKLIPRVPTIAMLTGEREREFVLSYDQEKAYLAAAEDTLHDFAILSLDSGVRAGEGIGLRWEDVVFEGAHGGRLGYIHIRERGRKHRKRILSMTPRVAAMLENRPLLARGRVCVSRPAGDATDACYLARSPARRCAAEGESRARGRHDGEAARGVCHPLAPAHVRNPARGVRRQCLRDL